LIRVVGKEVMYEGFFFFLRLYLCTSLLKVAKKKMNFNIGEEHKRKSRRNEETEKRNHNKKKME
jgi:hypothetical protein